MRSLLLPVLTALLLSGCAMDSSFIEVPVMSPRPNTPFTTVARQSLALIVDPSIVDAQRLADDADAPRAYATALTGWRRTLINGYTNGLGVYFSPVPAGKPADLALDIVRADVSWTPRGERLAVQIAYKAQLIDAAGKAVAVTAGTAYSKVAWTRQDGSEAACVNSAVETLYEQLATELVRPNVPANST